jgi:thiamine biosynthesis protein ThiS
LSEVTVEVNGERRAFASGGGALDMGQLLEMLGLGEVPVVVEHNGEALTAAERAVAVVREGDRLEIVRVVAGG